MHVIEKLLWSFIFALHLDLFLLTEFSMTLIQWALMLVLLTGWVFGFLLAIISIHDDLKDKQLKKSLTYDAKPEDFDEF